MSSDTQVVHNVILTDARNALSWHSYHIRLQSPQLPTKMVSV